MTSRERVIRCLSFQPVDRAPRDLWTLPATGTYLADMKKQVLDKYPGDFGRPDKVLGVGDRQKGIEGAEGTRVDSWGCVWVAAEDCVIGEVKQPPLADWAALAGYKPPWEVIDRANWQQAEVAQEANLKSSNPRFMLGGTTLRPFERMQFLRGTEDLYIDLAYQTAEVRRLRDMVHEFNLRELEHWCKTPLDGLAFMDDWGSQNSLLISPDLWRSFFKPLYKEYCDMMRRGGKKVFFHTDGNITAIYGDLIEIGMDAINSQLFVMDIEELGRLYRGKVTFWGEIDRQHVMPGPIEGVRQAVARVRRALDNGRGGVIAETEWGKNVRRENVEAVFEAWLA